MNRIFVASALFFTAIFSPIIPTDNEEAVWWAENHRKYLEQREVYMTAKQTELNIPQSAINKAIYAKDKFEETLIEKKYIKNKGDKIKSPNTSVLNEVTEKITSIDFVSTAIAYTFGKEDFESCGAIPCSFTAESSFGTGAMSLDATSKVNGTDSLRCDINTAEDGCEIYKDITSASEYYTQFYIFIPTGFTIGANGFLGLFSTYDTGGNPVYCSLEDYGTIRITCNGDELGYTDTGIDISLNTKTKLEFRTKISTTAGDLDIWKDNNTVGSPTYNGSGTLNTGSQNITRVYVGGYHPDIVNDKYYDDVIVDTAFIGAGTAPSSSPVEDFWDDV